MFAKKKFLQLEKRQQHKHCARLLRSLYERSLSGLSLCFLEYHALLQWMSLPLFSLEDPKRLSAQSHWHLQQSGISLKEHNLLPPIRRSDRTPTRHFGKMAIYLDKIRSAYNVGNILRTVEALRLGPVYFHPNTPFVDHDKVQKVSMGAYRDVPAQRVDSLDLLPRPLIALETGEEAEEIASFLFPDKGTLILGNEESEISAHVLNEVDCDVRIPHIGRKNSINAAAALAIAAQKILECAQKKESYLEQASQPFDAD